MSIPTPDTTVPPQSIPHPLDPLTEDEIKQTTLLLHASGRITPGIRLMAYRLEEPPKDLVLAFQAGQRVPREVFVVMRDHERRVTMEVLVSLTDEAIRSWKERDDVQPALTYPEVFAAQEAIVTDPAFQEAMAKRGITDLSSVVTYPFTAGYRSAADSAGNGRFIRMMTAMAQGPEDNYYAHPIEGVISTVELDSMRVQVEDHGVIPVPARSGNYTAEGIKAPENFPSFPHGSADRRAPPLDRAARGHELPGRGPASHLAEVALPRRLHPTRGACAAPDRILRSGTVAAHSLSRLALGNVRALWGPQPVPQLEERV